MAGAGVKSSGICLRILTSPSAGDLVAKNCGRGRSIETLGHARHRDRHSHVGRSDHIGRKALCLVTNQKGDSSVGHPARIFPTMTDGSNLRRLDFMDAFDHVVTKTLWQAESDKRVGIPFDRDPIRRRWYGTSDGSSSAGPKDVNYWQTLFRT